MVLPEQTINLIKENIVNSNLWVDIDKSKDFLGLWFSTDKDQKQYMLHFSNNEILIRNGNKYIRLEGTLLDFIKEQQ